MFEIILRAVVLALAIAVAVFCWRAQRRATATDRALAKRKVTTQAHIDQIRALSSQFED